MTSTCGYSLVGCHHKIFNRKISRLSNIQNNNSQKKEREAPHWWYTPRATKVVKITICQYMIPYKIKMSPKGPVKLLSDT